MHHEKYMQRCLELAKGGEGFVAPNPLVGAVLVFDEKIIAEGYHHHFGSAHAEVEVLKNIHDKDVLSKSTLYVNLEPCSHYGKTPPCVNLVIEKGIRKVIIANTDPNPLVDGRGLGILRNTGVKVTTGVLETDGMELNKRFFTFHLHKRPYIIMKWAQTANGYLAPASHGPVTWISNKSSRILVHKWRGEEQAIMVGRTTVETDNPKLTTRHFNKKNPLRIVVDPSLKLKNNFNLFSDGHPTMVFNYIKNEELQNVTYSKIKKGATFTKEMLNYLYERHIQSVIVEGGAATLNHFIEADCWDEARVFTGKSTFEHGVKAPVLNSTPTEHHNIDGDQLIIYRNKRVF